MNLVIGRLHLEIVRKDGPVVGALDALARAYGLHSQPQEAFWIIANDAAGNVRTIVEVARGRHSAVDVDIPSAMTAVLVSGAPAFSVAHNHPTLSALPSQSDMELTHALMNAANALGLYFEDHVIVEPTGDSFSFREAGLIVGPRGSTPGPRRAATQPSGRPFRKRLEPCEIHDRCDRTFRSGSGGAGAHEARVGGTPVASRDVTRN